jgi:C4-dicarboxylate-specific signal transduction histidine kinase
MAAAEVVQWLVAVRAEVDQACHLLISPSPAALDSCAHLLETARSRLAQLRPQLRQAAGNPAAQQEARRLRVAVMCAKRLLENACAFHVNWGRLLGALSAGYTERGDPAPAPRRGRICVQG